MAYTEIDNPTEYFSVNTWTADDTTPRSFTGFGHQPDLLWVKHRGSASISPTIIDSVRGGDKMLATPTTAAEDTKSHGEVTAFGSDGITVADGTNATYPKLYFNDLDPFGASVGGEYVCWSWKASGSTASNSSGDMTSTVSANTDAGFSIVSWTGDGTAGNTVGHGLNSAPEFILTKALADGTSSWGGYHIGADATAPEDYDMQIDGNGARIDTANMLNDTAPTSSLVTLGGATYSNHSSNPMIMYAWHSVQGYSKCGSYTGNGNADGTFVYTGFRPAWVIVKSTASGAGWNIHDAKRDTYNEMNKQLYANSNAADGSSRPIDFLSNGFKQRGTTSDVNNSGDTFFYTAFAEAPFVNSNGVPCNAR